jgi:propionyl-CoA synthetase
MCKNWATHRLFWRVCPAWIGNQIDDCKPRLIITASSGIEIDRLITYKPLVDEAIELASHRPKKSDCFEQETWRTSSV